MSKLFDQLYRTERREVPILRETERRNHRDSVLEIALVLAGFAVLGLLIAWEITKAMPIPPGQR